MNLKDAITHLKWRFTKSNIKASKNDITALNTLITLLNQEQEQTLNDNLNFCKLFIYCFKKMCLTNAINNDYKEIDLNIIYSKLKDVLEMDAKSHVNSLHKELEGIEIQRLIDNNELNNKTLLNTVKLKEVNTAMRGMLSEFIDNNK